VQYIYPYASINLSIYLYVYRRQPRVNPEPDYVFSLHKILFHDKALSWKSIILLLTSPTCKAYPIAILLHDHCAIHAPPPTPPLNTKHHTILAMAISCKGQITSKLMDYTFKQAYTKVYIQMCTYRSVQALRTTRARWTLSTLISSTSLRRQSRRGLTLMDVRARYAYLLFIYRPIRLSVYISSPANSPTERLYSRRTHIDSFELNWSLLRRQLLRNSWT